MEKVVASLYDQLLIDISLSTENSKSKLQKFATSYDLAVAAMQNLKLEIVDFKFPDEGDEISFYKEIMPRLMKESVYYYELKNLELGKPVGGKEVLKCYYDQAMEAVTLFFKNNQELYNYWRMGRSEFDVLYFKRGAEIEVRPELDSRFCTLKSYELARILGMEAVRHYLMNELIELELGDVQPASKDSDQIVWTDAKVKLIELGYALKFRGSINHGKISISKLMKYLGLMFGVDTSSHEVAYHQNIRLRKRKTRTVYLHELIESMESAMDYIDENPK